MLTFLRLVAMGFVEQEDWQSLSILLGNSEHLANIDPSVGLFRKEHLLMLNNRGHPASPPQLLRGSLRGSSVLLEGVTPPPTPIEQHDDIRELCRQYEEDKIIEEPTKSKKRRRSMDDYPQQQPQQPQQQQQHPLAGGYEEVLEVSHPYERGRSVSYSNSSSDGDESGVGVGVDVDGDIDDGGGRRYGTHTNGKKEGQLVDRKRTVQRTKRKPTQTQRNNKKGKRDNKRIIIPDVVEKPATKKRPAQEKKETPTTPATPTTPTKETTATTTTRNTTTTTGEGATGEAQRKERVPQRLQLPPNLVASGDEKAWVSKEVLTKLQSFPRVANNIIKKEGPASVTTTTTTTTSTKADTTAGMMIHVEGGVEAGDVAQAAKFRWYTWEKNQNGAGMFNREKVMSKGEKVFRL